jgi:2,5-furandicarboxylate decarboxylase 1
MVGKSPLGEFTGFCTPAAPSPRRGPIARVTAITHRNGAVFQALLTGIGGEWPPTENHILKQLS